MSSHGLPASPLLHFIPDSPMTARFARLAVVLAAGSSAACRPATPASGPELVVAAHRALGATDSIATLRTVATVASPSGGFEVHIASATDGRVRMALGKSLLAGVQGGVGWACDPAAGRVPLDSVTRSVIRGHDLHMLLLAPSWMSPPRREPDRRWGADSVLTLRYRDELGAPLLMHLRASDTIPVGLEIVNHTGSGPREVRVLFDHWQDHGGVRLFRTATFEHGSNRFVYSYTDLEINTPISRSIPSRIPRWPPPVNHPPEPRTP
jgi:hypothetical protein